jgi:hypothetical protein
LFVTGTGATIFFLGDLVFLATTLVPPMIWVSFVRTIASLVVVNNSKVIAKLAEESLTVFAVSAMIIS